MTRVLFVLQSMESGGTATSLLNLIELLKERGINVDLFLLQHEGLFLERAKKVANLLPEERIIASVLLDKNRLQEKGLTACVIRLIYVLMYKILGVERTNHIFYKVSAKCQSKKYDVVVAYQETLVTEYTQYIEAPKRIAWIHSNYSRFSMGRSDEYWKKLYKEFHEIVCVSKASKEAFVQELGLMKQSVHVIYNTISREYIAERSKEEGNFPNKRKYTFISMGRFIYDKAFERAVYASRQLKEKGIDFIWYILGDGVEFEEVLNLAEKEGVKDRLIFLGVKENPFPYVKQADCFVMTSRMEAQPMVLNEALTLGVPVITTEFCSAAEVVTNGENGFIVENSEKGVLDGIEKFIFDKEARYNIILGAKKFQYDNEYILNQVMGLIKC